MGVHSQPFSIRAGLRNSSVLHTGDFQDYSGWRSMRRQDKLAIAPSFEGAVFAFRAEKSVDKNPA
jgi:hypothetical protein